MAARKTFNYNDVTCEYFITYKQQKNMYLKVRNQQIIITAPLFISETVVEQFIIKNLSKIIIKQQNSYHLLNIGNGDDYLYFLATKYPLIIKYQRSKTTINFEFNNLVVYTNLYDSKQIMLKIVTFLKKEATRFFLMRAQWWAQMMNLSFSQLKVRAMTSKWGICQPQSKIVTFNYKLIHFASEIIDYVVIHELAHLVYPHHRADFWQLVNQYCLDYRQCRAFLKTQGV